MADFAKPDVCEMCRYGKKRETPLHETDFWRAVLVPNQAYVGYTVIALKQHKSSLSELSANEWADFQTLVPLMEAGARSAFGAELCNWTCLMNNAFKATPAYPHVHWHFRPRLARPISIAGQAYADPNFAHHYDRTASRLVDDATRESIRAHFRAHLQTQLSKP